MIWLIWAHIIIPCFKLWTAGNQIRNKVGFNRNKTSDFSSGLFNTIFKLVRSEYRKFEVRVSVCFTYLLLADVLPC